MTSLDDFLTALVKDKKDGLTLDDFQREDMKKDLSVRLNKFITLNVLTELATKDVTLLQKFQTLSKGTTTVIQIQSFIETHIVNGAAFLAKVLTDFRALYLGPA